MEKCTSACSARARAACRPAWRSARPVRACSATCSIPNSEIRYILEHKTVFRLKEELGTEPKFWYFTDA